MFFCKECANKEGWFYGWVRSHGKCEICDEVEECYDVDPRDYHYLMEIEHQMRSPDRQKEIAIAFHKWMRRNDTAENAWVYLHYTDEDMFNTFLEESENNER